jgi:PAS domain S-box-containing protein
MPSSTPDAEEALPLLYDEHSRTLAEAIPQMVFTTDCQGKASYFNRRWYEYTGQSPEESLGGRSYEMIHPDFQQEALRRARHSYSRGTPLEFECQVRDHAGRYRWHLTRALPVRDPLSGRVFRWFGTLTDIDDQKRAQEELRQALNLREDFLSIASHELRTPIASMRLQIQVLLKMLRDPGVDLERLQRMLALTERQGESLDALVDDLLDVTRMANGKLVLERRATDHGALVRDCLEAVRGQYEAAGVALEFDCGESVLALWDAGRVTQVVTNLLTNALKYGRGRPVRVESGPTRAGAYIRVIDQGVGIESSRLPRIFERFERVSQAGGGLGLGLYIAHQIVAAHGGEIRVESTPEVGSAFIVHLPA